MAQIRNYVLPFGLVLFLFACSRANKAPESPGTSDNGAIRGLVLARAQSISVAVSALESIDRGEIDAARATLESEVSSGLTEVYALREDARPGATAQEIQLIDVATREGEDYVSKKNLNVVRPNQ